MAALGLLMTMGSFLDADTTTPHLDEYQVKAAFLYNFAKFIDWPLEAFRNSGESFSICIVGEDPFGRTLDDLVGSKTISGRPVAVLRISDARQTGGCQILFVGAAPGKRVLSILAGTKRTGILTIGDAGLATAEGTIIGFTVDHGKVRFEIDTSAADRASLHISAKLLSLAQVSGK